MILRQAREEDVAAISALYDEVAAKMEGEGLHQWHWGDYPNEALIREDIARGDMYCVMGEHGMAIAVSVSTELEEAYHAVNWLFGVRPGVFYRLAVKPEIQDEGYGTQAIEDVSEILRARGCDAVRCDTYCENTLSIRLFAKLGMRQAGRIQTHRRRKECICYEKRLVEDCPLLPLRMHPAFRGGSLTPWGGEKLMTVYGKPIEDIPTGESLECSCVPDLESVDDTGAQLSYLVKKYGFPFAGRFEREAFPLLLKFIDAKDKLSIQVHPDDRYAHDNEHGKLGKTEAWLILDAPEGSQLVYGIKPGVTKEELRAACEKGSTVEELIRFVDVKPGDVCMIPSGCVHAIGAGIMLYEIQQSSDITYRFYDWDRVDKNGKKRELHLEKALDVTDLTIQRDPIPAPESGVARVLDETYFTLDLMHVDGSEKVPAIGEFGILTALDSELTLTWEGEEMTVHKGETLFVPRSAPALTLKGQGCAALSMPR